MHTKRHLILGVVALAAASLACSLLPGATPAIPATPTIPVIVPTVAAPDAGPTETAPPEPAEPPTEPPPDAQPSSGFLGGEVLDASSLPILPVLPMGVGPLFCEGQFDSPAVEVRNVVNEQMQLCLYNFPTAPDSPDITVTLAHPDGTAYSEVFVYVPEGESVTVEGQSGGTGGSIPSGDFAPPGPPAISIAIFTPANFPSAGWTAAASTADGGVDVPPTPITFERFGQQVSVVEDPAAVNPFIFPLQTFSAGDTIYVFGLGYDPDAAVTVVFYREDPALGESDFSTPQLRPEYATIVTTDASGAFNVEFAVGAATFKGQYYTVADYSVTTQSQANAFAGRFGIE